MLLGITLLISLIDIFLIFYAHFSDTEKGKQSNFDDLTPKTLIYSLLCIFVPILNILLLYLLIEVLGENNAIWNKIKTKFKVN